MFFVFSGLVFAMSAVATIYFSRSMSDGMAMPGGWTMSMMWMRMPGQTWTATAGMFMLMWLVMMVAMMLPSAMPMLLNSRQAFGAGCRTKTGLAVTMVAIGYFLVWMAIGVAVYATGVVFALATMRWSEISRAVPVLSGAALMVAGCLQFSEWKMTGLRRCRSRASCANHQMLPRVASAWHHGLIEGAACAVCCSAPMLALVVFGAMNLSAMIAVAVVIAMEKLAPKPELVARSAGAMALIAGVLMVARSLL